jgi:hypothetical protein
VRRALEPGGFTRRRVPTLPWVDFCKDRKVPDSQCCLGAREITPCGVTLMRSSDRYGPPPPLPAVVTLPEDSNAVEVAFRRFRTGDRGARVSAKNHSATRIEFGEIAEPDPRGPLPISCLDEFT